MPKLIVPDLNEMPCWRSGLIGYNSKIEHTMFFFALLCMPLIGESVRALSPEQLAAHQRTVGTPDRALAPRCRRSSLARRAEPLRGEPEAKLHGRSEFHTLTQNCQIGAAKIERNISCNVGVKKEPKRPLSNSGERPRAQERKKKVRNGCLLDAEFAANRRTVAVIKAPHKKGSVSLCQPPTAP